MSVSPLIRNLLKISKMDHNLIRRACGAPLPTPPKYKIRVAKPDEYNQVLNFMLETYFKTEPCIVNIGLSQKEPKPVMVYNMYEQVSKGLTLIAIDGKTNCVAGAAVNVVSRYADAERLEFIADKCDGQCPSGDLMSFYAFVAKQSDLWKLYDVTTLFECGHVAIHSDHQRQGLAKRLMQESWVLARDTGMKVFRIDCSSVYTARIAESFGWKNVWTYPYDRYTRNCKRVFKCIEKPHTEMKVYADEIKNCKDYYPPSKI